MQRGRPRTGRPRREKKYAPKKRNCTFCADKDLKIDYKDSAMLRRYVSDRGKIEPRRRSGSCARHQRMLAAAIKRARFIALLPYTPEHIHGSGGVGARS